MRLTLEYHALDTGVSRRDTAVSRREKIVDTAIGMPTSRLVS